MTVPTELALADIATCFEGAIPAVIATASADGVPNVTYLSKVRIVDDERVALSNQFFSKTARNLVENPRASVLLIDPRNYEQYRLSLRYERTDRRGPVFDRLRVDVDVAAALEGMQDVYRLRAADIYRVVDIEHVPSAAPPVAMPAGARDGLDAGRIAELSVRLGRCPDLDTVVETAVDGLAELFGYEHSLLMLVDEEGTGLYTIASHGYPDEGVGSEVRLGDGVIGLAAERGAPVTLGNVAAVSKYSRTVRRSYEDSGEVGPGREIPVPGLADAASRCAVPAVAMGQLVGVLTVESRQPVAFGPVDEAVLTVVTSIVANAIESERAREREAAPAPTRSEGRATGAGRTDATRVRVFAVDGSVFLDDEYLIKGVAGRILAALLGHHDREGRTDFTNREMRLDPSLDLPAFRDNFESRLILLKRRLDERKAPIRIDKTGRGRFRLVVDGPVTLDVVPED